MECRGSFGHEWTSCFDIVGDMPADERVLKFGPRSLPEVEQKLPLRIISCKCVESALSSIKLEVPVSIISIVIFFIITLIIAARDANK